MLKKYSLQQQLAIIFSFIAMMIILILLPFINNNLTHIIDEEMYDVLNQSQKYYHTYQFVPKDDGSVKQVYHFTYDAMNDVIYPTSDMTRSKAQKLVSAFSQSLENAVQYQKKEVKNKVKLDNQTVYFKITSSSNQTYLISLVFSDYSKALISNFNARVIYIFYASFLIMGIVLFLWVSSLISPMKTINQYVDDIKNEKNTSLHIEREDEIGNIATSLVEMKEEIDKQNKIKEEMIHNISHDLKTPIALIKTYSESIKDGIYPYGDLNASLDVILENSDRLEKKVRSLLYLNRLDYLTGHVGDDVCVMKDLIERIASQMSTLHKDIDIVLQVEDVVFTGKDEYWRICIENIIENAFRYVQHTIIITLKQDYLEIYNDGEPIDTSHYESLFKPYEIGNKGQFGLGLSIVYKTVTMYGYTIEAVNQNEGVSFIISK